MMAKEFELYIKLMQQGDICNNDIIKDDVYEIVEQLLKEKYNFNYSIVNELRERVDIYRHSTKCHDDFYEVPHKILNEILGEMYCDGKLNAVMI